MFKKYIDKYYVNEKGIIKNIISKKEYKGTKCSRGYLRVDVSINGKRNIIYPHRAVAETFIPNPDNKPQVNHKNGIKSDNRLENLEWCTAKENSKHAYNHNLLKIVNKKRISVVDKNGVIYDFESISEFIRHYKICPTNFYRNKINVLKALEIKEIKL